MTTGAFSRNVGKLFSELKLVTDNLLYLAIQNTSEPCFESGLSQPQMCHGMMSSKH